MDDSDRQANFRNLAAIFMSVADPILLTDPEGRITDINTEALLAYGWAAEELIGQPVKDLMPISCHEDVEKSLAKCLNGESAHNIESQRLHKSGRVRPVLMTVSLITNGQREAAGVAILTRDITALKEAEGVIHRYRYQLQSLAAELTRTEERERHRLADTLHDELAQQLVTCAMKLSLVDPSTLSADSAQHIRDVRELLDGAQRYTRTLMTQLSPTVVYDLGLVPALESMAHDLYQQYELRVHVESSVETVEPDDDVAIFLFRSIRELLTNVIKHSKVQEATVALDRVGGKLRAVVVDRGTGFRTEEWLRSSKLDHFGLFSIRERLEARGGSFLISSAVGEGTRVELHVPIEA